MMLLENVSRYMNKTAVVSDLQITEELMIVLGGGLSAPLVSQYMDINSITVLKP